MVLRELGITTGLLPENRTIFNEKIPAYFDSVSSAVRLVAARQTQFKVRSKALNM